MLHFGRLLQQYKVDQYIKLEAQLLNFFSFYHNLFRVWGVARNYWYIKTWWKRYFRYCKSMNATSNFHRRSKRHVLLIYGFNCISISYIFLTIEIQHVFSWKQIIANSIILKKLLETTKERILILFKKDENCKYLYN